MSTEAVAELKSAWEEFKKKNDQALAQKAEKGAIDAQLQEQIERINSSITSCQKTLTERADALERRIETDGHFGKPKSADGRDYAKLSDDVTRFFALERPQHVVRKYTVDEMKAYDAAFGGYLRRGPQGLSREESASLSVGSDPAGGYWVMPDRSGQIVSRIFETSPIRQIANVVTISTDAYEGPTDLNDADGGWTGETSDRDSTDTTTPTVGDYRIPVHEIFAQPKISQKLLDDAAFDVEGWLLRKTADKFARIENAAFVSGNGVSKPQGFLAGAAPVTTADATRTWGTLQYFPTGASGDFASSNPGNAIIDVTFGLKAAYRPNARWVMARSTEASVRKLKDGQGNYLWQPDFTQRGAALLNGFPITGAEDMPVIAANSLSAAFGDFREAYTIVDRMGIRLIRDVYTKKGWVKLYQTKRLGGGLVNSDALKLLKFAAS